MHTQPSFDYGHRGFPCVITPNGPNTRNRTTLQINTSFELSAYRDKYWRYASTFNPTEFNPTSLATLAKRAGFRYFVFTGSHDDGFLGWNSSLSSYNVVDATPFGRDTFGELAAAFRAQGLRAGIYINPAQVHLCA
jgi:alpha-L-fucosidase